jgi:hypothetical protein
MEDLGGGGGGRRGEEEAAEEEMAVAQKKKGSARGPKSGSKASAFSKRKGSYGVQLESREMVQFACEYFSMHGNWIPVSFKRRQKNSWAAALA